MAELWRYSVKSLRGERLDRVDVLAKVATPAELREGDEVELI